MRYSLSLPVAAFKMQIIISHQIMVHVCMLLTYQGPGTNKPDEDYGTLTLTHCQQLTVQ